MHLNKSQPNPPTQFPKCRYSDPQTPIPSKLPSFPSSFSTLNPVVPPFIPRATANRTKRSAIKKRRRLLMFPLCLQFRNLNNAQKAAIRISRKAIVTRTRQLKLLEKYVADVRLKCQGLHEQLAVFKQIARSLHNVIVETETEGSERRKRQILGKRKRHQVLSRALNSFVSTGSCRIPMATPNLPPSYQDQG